MNLHYKKIILAILCIKNNLLFSSLTNNLISDNPVHLIGCATGLMVSALSFYKNMEYNRSIYDILLLKGSTLDSIATQSQNKDKNSDDNLPAIIVYQDIQKSIKLKNTKKTSLLDTDELLELKKLLQPNYLNYQTVKAKDIEPFNKDDLCKSINYYLNAIVPEQKKLYIKNAVSCLFIILGFAPLTYYCYKLSNTAGVIGITTNLILTALCIYKYIKYCYLQENIVLLEGSSLGHIISISDKEEYLKEELSEEQQKRRHINKLLLLKERLHSNTSDDIIHIINHLKRDYTTNKELKGYNEFNDIVLYLNGIVPKKIA